MRFRLKTFLLFLIVFQASSNLQAAKTCQDSLIMRLSPDTTMTKLRITLAKFFADNQRLGTPLNEFELDQLVRAGVIEDFSLSANKKATLHLDQQAMVRLNQLIESPHPASEIKENLARLGIGFNPGVAEMPRSIDGKAGNRVLPYGKVSSANIEYLFTNEYSPGLMGAKAISFRDRNGKLKTMFWSTGRGSNGNNIHHRDALSALLEKRAENLEFQAQDIMDSNRYSERTKDEAIQYLNEQADKLRHEAKSTSGSSTGRVQANLPSWATEEMQGFQLTWSRSRGTPQVSRLDVDSSLTAAQIHKFDAGASPEQIERYVEKLAQEVASLHNSIEPAMRGYDAIGLKPSLYEFLHKNGMRRLLRRKLKEFGAPYHLEEAK